MEEIKLNYINSQKQLPKGIKIINVGEKIVFVKWYLGKFTVLPEEEQQKLYQEYVSSQSKNI
jgi:hypothetical protein